jgi:hypothetical protein
MGVGDEGSRCAMACLIRELADQRGLVSDVPRRSPRPAWRPGCRQRPCAMLGKKTRSPSALNACTSGTAISTELQEEVHLPTTNAHLRSGQMKFATSRSALRPFASQGHLLRLTAQMLVVTAGNGGLRENSTQPNPPHPFHRLTKVRFAAAHESGSGSRPISFCEFSALTAHYWMVLIRAGSQGRASSWMDFDRTPA